VAPGPANSYTRPGKVGTQVSLQLYRYKPPSMSLLASASSRTLFTNSLGSHCLALASWRDFLKHPASYPTYGASLNVTVSARPRPPTEILPRPLAAEHRTPVVSRCRLRLVDGDKHGEGLTVLVSMTFRQPVGSREVVLVELAPRFGLHVLKSDARIRVLSSVPAGAVLQVVAGREKHRLRLDLATGFESGDGLCVTLRLGDKASRDAWQAGYGAGLGWHEAVGDVVRSRPLAPWQYEREVPARGEMDSVTLMRAAGSKTQAGVAKGGEVMASTELESRERRYDASSDAWCRAPNTIKHSLPAMRHGCSCVAFSPCGKWLAVAMHSQEQVRERSRCVVQIHDAGTAQVVAKLEGHLDLIYDLHWVSTADKGARSKGGADGDESSIPPLLSASKDCTARAWQVVEDKNQKMVGALVSTAYHPAFCYCAAWAKSPSASNTGVAVAAARMVALWPCACYDSIHVPRPHACAKPALSACSKTRIHWP
jgi:hypothetical protein